MQEIYDAWAPQYDELVAREDHAGLLRDRIRSFLRGANRAGSESARVLELGAGTGRVTACYIDIVASAVCCDKSRHMLDRARLNLAADSDRIEFLALDTRDPSSLHIHGAFDIAIEGWSLGHTAIDENQRIDHFLGSFFQEMRRLLRTGGRIALIETLGTNVDHPAPPSDKLAGLYDRLETNFGLTRETIRTDYRFNSVEDARRIMGFFFGDEMARSIRCETIPEYTGFWTTRP